jgi:hypothetical protein
MAARRGSTSAQRRRSHPRVSDRIRLVRAIHRFVLCRSGWAAIGGQDLFRAGSTGVIRRALRESAPSRIRQRGPVARVDDGLAGRPKAGAGVLPSTPQRADTTINGVRMQTEQGATSERWITIMHACEVAGVSRRTIYNSIEKGLLTTRRRAGGTRILESSLFRADAGG